MKDEDPEPRCETETRKRPYLPPRLVEYGDVRELAEGGDGDVNDDIVRMKDFAT